MRITLDFHLEGTFPVDASGITPEHCFACTPWQVDHFTLHRGGELLSLAEFCTISRSPEQEDGLILTGTTHLLNNIGWGLKQGKIEVRGSTGSRTGAEMVGGEVLVEGSADDYAGAGILGGLLRIGGSAGNFCGAALPGNLIGMRDGVIIIGGNVGDETGARMRGGLMVVKGSSGDYTAANMLAGTLMVFGEVGKNAGVGMKRGSLIGGSLAEPLLTGFVSTGTVDDEWLKIYFNYLEGLGLNLPTGWKSNRWQRWSGDHLQVAKGEILIHEPV